VELRHLYTFQMIVREGSFLQAAEKLRYAQSTITLHMQQLESELGVKLFARQGKKVQLTEAGRALRDQADLLLHRAEALQQSMRDIVAGEAGHLRLGSIEPTASHRLPSFLALFFQQHPKMRLTLEVGGTQSISQRVAAGHLDVGICSPPPAQLDLTFEPLFVEDMALLLPTRHPLAEKDTICLADLVDQRLLLTEPGCAYRAVIEQAMFEHGTNPYAGIEIGSLMVLQHAVQSNVGVAIVPTNAASPPPAGTVLREVSEIRLGLPVGFVQRADDGSAGQSSKTMLASLRAQLRAEGGESQRERSSQGS
jgi:LysR family transcriptional regulator, regulator of the ytmI operon